MANKRRLSAAEFETIRPLLDISAERIDAARAYLVDGATAQAVGDKYGWSKQAVAHTVKGVKRMHEKYLLAREIEAGLMPPPGWELVTLIAPKELAAKFRQDVRDCPDALPDTEKSNRRKS